MAAAPDSKKPAGEFLTDGRHPRYQIGYL